MMEWSTHTLIWTLARADKTKEIPRDPVIAAQMKTLVLGLDSVWDAMVDAPLMTRAVARSKTMSHPD